MSYEHFNKFPLDKARQIKRKIALFSLHLTNHHLTSNYLIYIYIFNFFIMSLEFIVPKVFHIFINIRISVLSDHGYRVFIEACFLNSWVRQPVHDTRFNVVERRRVRVGRGQRSCDREGEPLLGWQDEPIMTVEWDTKWNTVAIGGIYRTDRRTVVKLSGGRNPRNYWFSVNQD